ncbi:N-formylglutamate amidohydrolase [Mesorhizobium sp. AR02]|uniref:N-formylglutamate amidohydrolase n=1 Tax=Mesorhizobium sp. AR02 TaxID=2865837 RepID=UPI00215FBA16|nr:N-formylglutamate amidohydrolase [Mesorhizobium sp. AR02]UVK55752.1 N-formylglutamate amidohydrolase [Mesorhizobium sp. AR02]
MPISPERQAELDGLGEDNVEILNPDGGFPCLILCDHASSALPSRYGALGLAPDDLRKHIGVDIGIDGVARGLAARLDAPLLSTRWSRLLLDCNRWIADPRLILSESDGIDVPANHGITDEEWQLRCDRYFWPYHRAVGRAVEALRMRERFPFLLSLHSCTRQLGSDYRKWDAGTIWHESDSLSNALIEALGQRGDLLLGDNAPYSGIGGTFTIDYHSWGTGLPACGLEIVNDGLRTDQAIAGWTDRLTAALAGIAARREQVWTLHNGRGHPPLQA